MTDAQQLRAIAERLCAVRTGSEAEIREALGVPTTPPPVGARACEITPGALSMAGVDLKYSAAVLTRDALDIALGGGRIMPVTGPRATHTIAYEVKVAGAPARVNVFARFADAPEPSSAVLSLYLRIDPAH